MATVRSSPDVVREVDRGHAAVADFTVDAVAAGECFRQAGECIDHRAAS